MTKEQEEKLVHGASHPFSAPNLLRSIADQAGKLLVRHHPDDLRKFRERLLAIDKELDEINIDLRG